MGMEWRGDGVKNGLWGVCVCVCAYACVGRMEVIDELNCFLEQYGLTDIILCQIHRVLPFDWFGGGAWALTSRLLSSLEFFRGNLLPRGVCTL